MVDKEGEHHGQKKHKKKESNTAIKHTRIQFAIGRRKAKEMEGLGTEKVPKTD